MTATQSIYEIGGTNQAGVLQSGDTAIRLMSWHGGVRELQYACSPDGLLVARSVRLSGSEGSSEVTNNSSNPVTHIRLHNGETADCAYRGDITTPPGETTQPWAMALADGGDVWLSYGSGGTSLRLWRYNGDEWDRFPSSGALSTPSSAQHTIEVDDGVVHLTPTGSPNSAVLRLNLASSTTTTVATVAALRTFVGGTFSGTFQRSWGDGAGGVYVTWFDSAGPGAGRDGIYRFNAAGVATAKVYSRVSTVGSDNIARDVDGHWWEAVTSSSIRHTFPDGSYETFSLLTPFTSYSTAGFPRRGPRCRPLPKPSAWRYGLHFSNSGFRWG